MGSETKKDLIIGDTSQVAQYLSSKIIRCSSRNIDEKIFLENWDRVYICFAEQRTSLSEITEYKDLFYNINYKKTKMVADKIKAVNIVFLSTTELWNMQAGPIDLEIDYNFRQNYYTDSKLKITEELKNRENVIIAYPFNFNSKFRSKYFLFGKILSSIINKEKVQIGNVDFYRDLMHAKYVSRVLESLEESKVIGTGRLTHIGDFIKDLYIKSDLEYEEYVSYHKTDLRANTRVENWCAHEAIDYNYNDLILDTMLEIR